MYVQSIVVNVVDVFGANLVMFMSKFFVNEQAMVLLTMNLTFVKMAWISLESDSFKFQTYSGPRF